MQANQEKTLETSLENITSRVQDLKTALTSFLAKLEHEHQTLNWPTVLDNFALLSGQINMLNKVLRHDKTPSLKEYVLLPLNLKQDRDEELEKMTEGRVGAFNHEVVPNYLRTKLVPETEERELVLIKEAVHLTPEVAQRQINALNKLSNHVLDIVNSAREEREADTTGGRIPFTTSASNDTSVLMNSMITGRGLRQMHQVPQPGAYMRTGPGMVPGPGQYHLKYLDHRINTGL
ncbi:mediator of RNA polymerase II transcription subunit 8-like isoform X2 [Amphiura filiformis]|uniref:mediator of RNA polymerase II transcription subunit 8-like isoform X1 n=1 Tax=Amphiura filiformis TaxID=82378 RepID=UPI003B225640